MQVTWTWGIGTAGVLLPCLAGAAGLAAPGAAPAAPAPRASVTASVDAAFFAREVQPILERRCLGCHGVERKLGNLDLRSRGSALKGGVKGPALVPGNANRSLLFRMVSGQRTPLMPPQGKLPAAEVAVLRRWVDGGAPWSGESVETARKQVWWSFQPPVLPAIPTVKNRAWVRNPVDAFVLARLEATGLRPNPPAPRSVLIRRAYLDLIGLPPTPDEVDAFVNDRAPGAWERVVDRLLASPRYGERWGRHWLDLVRFAESSGFEGDKDRPNAWKYRDYVIKAFNEDKPYDQFLREQLAGDEIRPGDREATVATGYLGLGLEDFAMAKLPMTRADELDDMVSTTGSTVLGLTVGCARCHDHKYDPVTQKDYYRLAAIFAPTERREVDIPTPEERKEIEGHNAGVDARLAPLRTRLAELKKSGEALARQAGKNPPKDDEIVAALPEPERKEWTKLQADVKATEAQRRAFPKAMAVTDKGREYPRFHLMVRGDANHKGPEVDPGFITALPGGEAVIGPEAATASTTGRRRVLAEWLTSPNHPLTARVWVNRVWRQHFGRGIVGTVSNFGLNGDLPTHPELLDWLAVTFVNGGMGERENGRSTAQAASHSSSLPLSRPPGGGWTLKRLHRLLLLSNTFQQSSEARADGLRMDPENKLLWRMGVRRLEAEAIRDSVLAVAGTLNLEMGGPPVYPPVDPSLRADTFQGVNWPEGEDSPKTWRRSVYIKVKRSLLFPQLEVFDCPEITAAVAARNVTTTPNQALTMLNDPLVLRQAALFAERLQKDVGPDPARQVERAYRLALGRAPKPRERELAVEFLKGTPALPDRSRLAEFCHAILNLSELIYVP